MAESLWVLPFGVHRGKPIEDTPAEYLNYLLEQDWFCTKFANKVPIVEKELKFRKDNPGQSVADLDVHRPYGGCDDNRDDDDEEDDD